MKWQVIFSWVSSFTTSNQFSKKYLALLIMQSRKKSKIQQDTQILVDFPSLAPLLSVVNCVVKYFLVCIIAVCILVPLLKCCLQLTSRFCGCS